MPEETVNVAEAKKHFSELLGRVAFGKKHILITKRGKPMPAWFLPTKSIFTFVMQKDGSKTMIPFSTP